jgi:hypothetical protein
VKSGIGRAARQNPFDLSAHRRRLGAQTFRPAGGGKVFEKAPRHLTIEARSARSPDGAVAKSGAALHSQTGFPHFAEFTLGRA